MKTPLRDQARIGFVHHLLHKESVLDPEKHQASMRDFFSWPEIEAADFCLPFEKSRRERIGEWARASKFHLCYANYLYPNKKIPICSPGPVEKEFVRIMMRDQAEAARISGATQIVFSSGADFPEDRNSAQKAMAEFCIWFGKLLEPMGIMPLLEPFDRTVDKKYLFGPIADCVSLVETVHKETKNFGIELDVGHLPLMGEDFAKSIRAVAAHLHRVHLSSSFLKDTASPWYGDSHPPFGFPDGLVGEKELIVIFQTLLEIGYLGKEKRGVMSLEIQPFPGKTAGETMTDNMRRIEEAWAKI